MVTAFGSIAVGVMLISYWLEARSKWFVLAFAGGCAATATYSGIVQAWPAMVVEAVWGLVALSRFIKRRRNEALGHAQAGRISG